MFALGQVYDVAVLESLKGDATPTVRVMQTEGIVTGRGETPVAQSYSDDEIAHMKHCALQDGQYVPMDPGARYVFFLDAMGIAGGFDPELGYHTGSAGIPWRFVYNEGGTLIPESPVDVANKRIGQITLDEVTSHIQGGN